MKNAMKNGRRQTIRPAGEPQRPKLQEKGLQMTAVRLGSLHDHDGDTIQGEVPRGD
jgi:hypothetical protein